jgi:hypothetical protein
MPRTRLVHDGDRQVILDLSTQVLRFDAPESFGFGGRALLPALPRSRTRGHAFVSAGTLAMKAKSFDDGLYAGVELAAQQGAGTFSGKRALLTTLARHLEAPHAIGTRAAAMIFAACRLGHVGVEVPLPARVAVDALIADFLGDPIASKPLGFYTWRDDLAAIFQQDRLLQQPLDPADGAAALAGALQRDDGLRHGYDAYLRLVAGLTNPFADMDLRNHGGPASGSFRFCPPARSIEGDLMQRLFGSLPVPDGFSLVDEIVARLREGRLTMQPTADSGWYDHQLWSIAPLACPERTPEAARLELTPDYREHLLEVFKSLFSLSRETHVKQLAPVMPGASMPPRERSRPFYVAPELSAEPLATCYLRRAQSYRFVTDVLTAAFGSSALMSLRRLRPDGAADRSLLDELADMQAVFYGAHTTVLRELGFESGLDQSGAEGRDNDADAQAFARWATDVDQDEDVSRDARMMVPVFYDLGRRQTKVWAFLGWTEQHLGIDFARPPRIVAEREGLMARMLPGAPDVRFVGTSRVAPRPVTAELYVDTVLNRDEFRRVCDRCDTREEIVATLQSRRSGASLPA